MSPKSSASNSKLRRSIRLGVAAITSTALVGGVVVAAPAHPLLPATAVAQAQETPEILSPAYAHGQVLNLDLLQDLLTTSDPRGVEGILELIEAEQEWNTNVDDGQGAETSSINLELLGLLKLNLGSLEIPLASPTGQSILKGDLGLLNAYASAPNTARSTASAGAVTSDGSIDVGAGNEGSAEPLALDLTNLLGIDLPPELIDELSLSLGAVASTATKENGAITSDYHVADANLNVSAPVLGDVVGAVETTIGEVEVLVNGLLGTEQEEQALGLLSGVLATVAGTLGLDLTLGATVDLSGATEALLNEPLQDESGLVSINLGAGTIDLDLDQLHPGGLSEQSPNTPLLTNEGIDQITSTITSLLIDPENPNGLISHLEAILMGNQETKQGGLYATEVEVDLGFVEEPRGLIAIALDVLLGWLLEPIVGGATFKTTLGGLLNPDATATDDVDFYNALTTEAKADYVLITGEGVVGSLLEALLGLVSGLLGTVGGIVEPLLFGDGNGGGVIGSVNGIITPLLDGVTDTLGTLLLNDVLPAIADITLNRQNTNTDGSFTVSALEVSILSGTLGLPLATSTITAQNSLVTSVSGTPQAVDPVDSSQTTGLTVINPTEQTVYTAVDEDNADIPVTVDPTTGEIFLNPGYRVDGPITLTVSDPSMAGTDYTVTIEVTGHTSGVDDNSDGALLLPEYQTTVVEQDSTVTVPAPTFDDLSTPGTKESDPVPAGATFAEVIDLDWVGIDPATGVLTLAPTAAVAPGEYSFEIEVTFADASTRVVEVPVSVLASPTGNAGSYTPNYDAGSVAAGGTSTIASPEFRDSADAVISNPPLAADAPFSKISTTPAWATVNPDEGSVALAPSIEVAPGNYTVPVRVDYADGTYDIVLAAITVSASTLESAGHYDPAYTGISLAQDTEAMIGAPTFDDLRIPGVQASQAPTGTTFAADLPAWASIDSGSGAISLSPTSRGANLAPVGPFTFEVTVTYLDNSSEVVQVGGNVTATALTPTDFNDPVYAAGTVTQDEPGQVPAPTFDNPRTPETEENEAPTDTEFTLGTGAPAWVVIDAATGMLSLSPESAEGANFAAPGNHYIPVVVRYDGGSEDRIAVRVMVEAAAMNLRYAPVYQEGTVHAGDTAGIAAPTFDNPATPETESESAPADTRFSLGAGAPSWVSINPQTGAIGLAPGSDIQAENDITIPVTVTFSDNTTADVETSVDVTEQPSNDRYHPSYSAVQVTAGEELVGAAPTFDDMATDEVESDAAPSGTTFALGAAAPEWAKINLNTGVITFTPPEDIAATELLIPVEVTYGDESAVSINAAVEVLAITDASRYTPDYEEGTVTQDEEVTIPAPTFDDTTTDPTETDSAPENTIFSGAPEGVPAWAEVQPDGSIVLTPSSDPTSEFYADPDAEHSVTVIIDYADESTEEIQVPINLSAATVDQSTLFNANYTEVSAAQDEATQVPSPAFDLSDTTEVETDPAPENTTFGRLDSTPAWAEIAEDGSVTLNPSSDPENENFVAPGTYEVPVEVIYQDDTTETSTITVTIGEATGEDSDSSRYDPAYESGAVKIGEPGRIPAPAFDDTTTETVEELAAPEGTSFATGAGAPDWVTVDQDSGAITLTPGESVTAQAYQVPVIVTYADESTDTALVDITVSEAEVVAPSFGGTPIPVEPTDEEQDTGLDVENGTEDTEVRAEDEDGKEIPVGVDEDGNILVTPGEDVDGPITVIIEDPALDAPLTQEVPVNGHEKDRDDNEDGQTGLVSVIGDPQAVNPTDVEQSTGLTLVNGTEETAVSAVDEDGTSLMVVIDPENGEITVIPGVDVDGPITVTVTDLSLDEPIVVEVPVTGHAKDRDDNAEQEIEAPSVGGTPVPVDPSDEEQDTGLDLVNGTEDTVVSAVDEDGTVVPVQVDGDGDILVTPGVDVDGPITVTVTDPSLDESIVVEVPVTGHAKDRDDNAEQEVEAPSVGGTPIPVTPTDDLQDTGLNVENGTEDTEVTATDATGREVTVTVDDDGDISVVPGTTVVGPITVTITDPALETPITEEIPVIGANAPDVDTDVTVGANTSWIQGFFGIVVGLLGLGGIFAAAMEFMHQTLRLDRAADVWWLNITGRDGNDSQAQR